MQFFYTVRPGDTLYQIAERWQLPVESLIAANNLKKPYTIYDGQQLSIPPGVDRIRIKKGDTVYAISQFYGVPQSAIIKANRLSPPYMLQAGQLLNVPRGLSYYVVQPGDTLFQIGKRFNVTTNGRSNPEWIRQINGLLSYALFPGMKLLIPYVPPGGQGFIAYTSNAGGTDDIWLYNPATGLNKQITDGLGAAFSVPFWSPDSRNIAFVGKNNILYVIQLTRGTIVRIDQFSEEAGHYISWSPDSRKFAYAKQNEIILYDLLSQRLQKITQHGVTDVQWFASGTELLFQAPDPAGISQLYRMRTDGTRKQQITKNTGGLLNHVRLSPDNLFVLYTTPGVSISLIYTVEIATGNVFEVKGGPLGKNYFPVWSPNSSTIAYSATAFEEADYFSLIRTAGKRGEKDQTKALSSCFASPVTWSPDNRKLAFLSGCYNQGAASEIWLFDVLHPVPIRLVKGAAIRSLQWSPAPVFPMKKTYTSPDYQVQFQFPGNWERVTEERFEGPDGFFQVSALFSEKDIHGVCHDEAFHQLLPYGSAPRITQTQIQHQEACFIFPSEDQPPEMKNQAALIVRYPKPIQLNNSTYNYFVLWADQHHLRELSSTLVFLK